MKTWVVLLFLYIPFCAATQRLQYVVRPSTQPDGTPSLSVVLLLETLAPADTVWFTLPNRLAWSSGVWRCIRNIDAEWTEAVCVPTFPAMSGPAATPAERGEGRISCARRDSTHFYLATLGCEGALMLRYDVTPLSTDGILDRRHAQTPILEKDWLQAPGELLFLYPQFYACSEVSVRWELPPGWQVQSNFDSGPCVQHFVCDGSDWRNALWVAGDFRFHRDTVFDKPVCFALRGQWAFSDATMFRSILKTVATQRAQWNDRDIPYFSVTMLPLSARRDQQGRALREMLGYGQHRSFAVYVGPECSELRLLRLFNHEMMHEWIGGKIKDSRDGASMDWFAEGFTDYYALRNCWKAGFISEAEYFSEWNERYMELHYADPIGEMCDSLQRRERYRDDRAFKMIYRRGAIFAFWLDCAIRSRNADDGHTLHHLMLDLMAWSRASGRYLADKPAFFADMAAPYLGERLEKYVDLYIRKGRRIPASEFRLPAYMRMETGADGIPRFSLRPDDARAVENWLKD